MPTRPSSCTISPAPATRSCATRGTASSRSPGPTASRSSRAARTARRSRRSCPAIPDKNVFLESEPRDSAAAIGLAAAILSRREPDVIIGSFAADHVIRGTQVFDWAVQQAVAVAREGYICTIGIPPTEPAVGFGYMKKAGELVVAGAPEAALVERFVEKPDLDTAREYLADRSYLWNAGMFISRADVLLGEIAENEPQLYAGLMDLAEVWDDRDARGPVVDRVWPTITKIAIDYAVAEPAAAKGRLAVIPGHFDWDDVGDFASLAKLNSHGRGNDLAILGENARILADASSGIVVSQTQPGHQRDRRQGHRDRRHRGRAAGHHERARPAGEGRRGRPQAHRSRRRALTDARMAAVAQRGIRCPALLRLCNHSPPTRRSGMQARRHSR